MGVSLKTNQGVFMIKSLIGSVLVFLSMMACSSVEAASYYVSSSDPNRNDSGPGTSAQPWATLAKVNATALAAGDTVYFKCGDTWRETLTPRPGGTAAGRLTYTSYGSGNKPIISGAEVVTGWTVYAGGTANTYSVPMATATYMVTKDNTFLSKGSSPTTLAANQYRWEAGVLYINTGGDPSSNVIEAAQRNNAVFASVPKLTPAKNYVTLRGLSLQKTNLANVCISDVNYWIVEDCDLFFSNDSSAAAGGGINSDTAHYAIYRNNHINYSLGDGILAWRSHDVEVSGNLIENVLDGGTYSGADGIQIGAKTTTPTACNNYKILNNTVIRNAANTNKGCIIAEMGDNGLISGNICEKGNFGIAPSGNNITVEYNYVNGFGVAGGIRVSENTDMSGMKIRYNLVTNSPGFAGITLTIDEVGQVNNRSNFEIHNNVVYNTYYGIGCSHPFSGSIKNNIVWSPGSNPRSRLGVASQIPGESLVIDNNILQDKGTEAMLSFNGVAYYDLASWQAATGFDTHSSSADPLWVNAAGADFHLQAGSPAINAGTTVGGLSEDFEGNAVPNGAAPDIGIYEYYGASLAPVVIEAESVSSITASDPVSVFTETEASAGAGSKVASNAVGDYINYPINVPAGTYTVKVRFKKYSSRGIFQLTIDGANQGTPQDEYASTASYVEVTLGTKVFATSGTRNFKFTVTGRNAANTSAYYDLTVDRITLTP
jgi:hypothetical protein